MAGVIEHRHEEAVSRGVHVELFSLLRDRRLWRGPAIWVLLILVAINPAVVSWQAVREAQVGVEMAGQGRFADDPAHAKRPVRYDWSTGDRYETFLRYIPDSRRTNLVIISGMSQMYTINDYRPTDQTISEWMDDALAPTGTRVFGLAAPNLSHEEGVFHLLSTLSQPQTKPDVFIFAVAFEKSREVDLRRHFLAHLRRHPDLTRAWRSTAERYRTQYPLATAKMLATLEALERDAATKEDTFESRLRRRVSDVVPLVKERRSLNSELRIHVFGLRNFLLGIKNTTKRPIIRDRYDTNREFIGVLADVGRAHGVKVLLFIVPFNPHAENPYVPEEYASFKGWLSAFAAENQIPLANLESAVPPADWGLFLGGPDFKHFRGEGHRKSAAALLQAFATELRP